MAKKSEEKGEVIVVDLTAEEAEQVAGGKDPICDDNFYTDYNDRETNYCHCHGP